MIGVNVLPNSLFFPAVFWQLNFKRFHQDFRDQCMISAVERKLGSSAAECFKYILKQMYERTDPWQRVGTIKQNHMSIIIFLILAMFKSIYGG